MTLIGGLMVEMAGLCEHLWLRRPLRKHLHLANREGQRRLVRIPRPFAIARYELAHAEWMAAQADPDWRLPTEAEWETAARARTATAYQKGTGSGRTIPPATARPAMRVGAHPSDYGEGAKIRIVRELDQP